MYCGTNAKYCVNRKPVNLVCLTCVAKFTGEARAITGICSIMKQMDDYILFSHSVFPRACFALSGASGTAMRRD